MKPSRAARNFVRVVTSHHDFIDLVEPIDGEQRVKVAFRKVEKAVWRSERLKPQDTVKLGNAVLESVPKKRRKKLAKAFEAYERAETNYLLVREQTAYLVGLEMGRRTRR